MLLITHTPLSLFSRSLLKYKSQAKWHYSTSYAPQAPEAPKPHTTSDVSGSDALDRGAHEYTGSSGYSQKQGHRDWLLIKGNRKRKALSVGE